MPWNRSLYLKNWEVLAAQIKSDANWVCQGCGKPCRKSGESIDNFLARCVGLPEDEVREHPTKWVLTVAHLNHDPSDNRPENLKPLCAPCHCRMDIKPSAIARKRFLHRERAGQLTLNLG